MISTSRLIKVPPQKCPAPKLKISSTFTRIDAKYLTDSARATVPLITQCVKGMNKRETKKTGIKCIVIFYRETNTATTLIILFSD